MLSLATINEKYNQQFDDIELSSGIFAPIANIDVDTPVIIFLFEECSKGNISAVKDITDLLGLANCYPRMLLTTSANHQNISRYLIGMGVVPDHSFYERTVDLPSFVYACKTIKQVNKINQSLLYHHRDNDEAVKVLLQKGAPVTIPWYKYIIKDTQVWIDELRHNPSNYSHILDHALVNSPDIAIILLTHNVPFKNAIPEEVHDFYRTHNICNTDYVSENIRLYDELCDLCLVTARVAHMNAYYGLTFDCTPTFTQRPLLFGTKRHHTDLKTEAEEFRSTLDTWKREYWFVGLPYVDVYQIG